jgi:ketosteroid isomerase-like protein
MKSAYLLFTTVLLGLAVNMLAMAETPDTADQAAIKKILNDGCQSWISGKAQESVDLYVNDIVVYDIAPPRQKNHDQVVQFNKMLAENTVGKPICVYEEIHPVVVSKNFAYSYSIIHAAGKMKDGKEFDFRERSTNVWKKIGGKWRCLHEHNSVPVDVVTGQADLQSKP